MGRDGKMGVQLDVSSRDGYAGRLEVIPYEEKCIVRRSRGRRPKLGAAGLHRRHLQDDVNPVAHIAETLRAILDGHPRRRVEELMPWHFRKASSLAT
jgi:hypothetical protein